MMKRLAVLALLGVTLETAACASAQPADALSLSNLERKVAPALRRSATSTRFVPVIIRLNLVAPAARSSSAARSAAIVAAADRVIAQVPASQMQVVRRFRIVPSIAASVNSQGLAALAALPEVREIIADEPDQALTDRSTRLVEANNVWPISNGAGRLVAILDDGTDARHPFVAGRVLHEACFRRDKKCPNRRATQIGGGAARNQSKSHGMHVAGIAAGANGSYRTRRLDGVAPGANLIAINVFSATGAFASDQVAALEYVLGLRESGVAVVAANMSLGSGKYKLQCDADEEERVTIIEQLLAANVATVIAAGNTGHADAVSRPGCISSAVTVSSATDADRLHTGHNRSSLTDVVAPGITIFSAVPDRIYGGSGVGDYRSKSGTSMASPHVSGAFALLSAAAPHATVQQILAALVATGRELIDPASGKKYRRIDLDDALARLDPP